MVSVETYTALVTSEHRDQPKFAAVLDTLLQPLVDLVNLELALPSGHFDLDTAVGAQLDRIGEWVGISRLVPVPITGVFFTWDDTVQTGWDQGYWKGTFDPAFGVVSVADEVYRKMIRARIAANAWDGTLESAYVIWNSLFGAGAIKITDNMDMTITVTYASSLSNVYVSLLTNGSISLKPVGVKVTFVAGP